MSAAKPSKAAKPQGRKGREDQKAAKAAKRQKVVDIKDAPKKVAEPGKADQRAARAAHHREDLAGDAEQRTTYSFRVRRDSTKPEIKAAVELMFGVKVANVNVVNETGKTRRFGKVQGRTQDIKKAYVRLAPARRSTTKPSSRPEGS